MAQPRVKPSPRPRPKARPGPPAELIGVLVGLGVLIAIAIGILWYATHVTTVAAPTPAPTAPGQEALPAQVTAKSASVQVGEQRPLEPAQHIPTNSHGSWKTDPPSSGQHWPIYPPWGPAQQAYPPEYWVHSLEHGGVVVLFRDAGDSSLASSFAARAPKESEFGEVKVVDAPYPNLTHRFALVAWGWVYYLDTWSDADALRFYAAHVDRGPEDIP